MTPARLNAPELLAMLREVAEVMAPAGYNASFSITLPEEQCATVEEVARLAGIKPRTHSAGASDEEPYTIVCAYPFPNVDVHVQSHRYSQLRVESVGPGHYVVSGGGQ